MAFKLCTIGCGGISTGVHGPSYVKYRRENPDFETAACCDIDPQKAAAYANRFGFARHYTNFTEMLRKEKPDAVCVTVDEDHIAEVGVAVLNLGFPMFIEKPPGKNSRETLMLIDAARKANVINQVGYNRRHMPILQRLREMVALYERNEKTENSAAGCRDGLQHIRYDFYRVGRFDEDFSDTAVHGIDAVRYLTGADYVRVNFSYQALPQYGTNVQNIYMDCTMSSGVHAALSFCPVTGAVLERATISAKDNTWIANTPIWAEGYDKPGELIHIYKNRAKAVISAADLCGDESGREGGAINESAAAGGSYGGEVYITNGFYNENKAFFDCVRKGQKSACDLESALNTSLVKDCITNHEPFFELCD